MTQTLEDELRGYAVELDRTIERHTHVVSAPSAVPARRGSARRRTLVALVGVAGVFAIGVAIVINAHGTRPSRVVEAPVTDATVTGPTVTGATVTAASSAPPTAADPKSDSTALATSLDEGSTGPDVVRLQTRLTALHFALGNIDGVFGDSTRQAVWAYKLLIDGVPAGGFGSLTSQVTPELWQRMQDANTVAPRRPAATGSTHVEIYLPEQVMVVFTGNAPTLIAHISTGTGQAWCESITVDTNSQGDPVDPPSTQPVCGVAITPPGVFAITRTLSGTHTTPLGVMTNPVYFNAGIAIAGAMKVPAFPSSHGGVCVDNEVAAILPSLVSIGDQVYAWGDDGRQPEQYTKLESTPILHEPGSPVAVSPTTSVPNQIEVLALGDSVMAGAQSVLFDHGVLVDAMEGRGFTGMMAAVQTYARAADVSSLVVQLGTNGPVSQSQYDALIAAATGVPTIYVMTVSGPASYVDPNNAIIRALPSRYPNVKIIDWETTAQTIEGELSPSDGYIHLRTTKAIEAYANLILSALGQSTITTS